MKARLAAAPPAPLIGSVREDCRECWGCVRTCPARAIRVLDRHSEVIEEKCVKCGLCVSECGHAGHVVRDDTPRVWELLDSGRPVVAVLATEFVAALYPMRPAEVEATLESLGFFAAESTVLGEEIVAVAYANLCSREGAFPVVRSTCPVVVEWVKRYHPGLTQALAPVVPPYIAQARLVKALYPEDTAVVYVSPCYARKDEVYDPELADAVDVAIDFFELARMIESGRRKADHEPAAEQGARRPSPMKELSLTDGFPRNALASQSLLSNEIQVVRGLRALDRTMHAIERGESGPVIVDVLNCEGCIDGPAVSPGTSVFAKRNIEASERESQGRSVVSSRALLRHLPSVDTVRAFRPKAVRLPRPGPGEVDAILAEGGFASREETIDCGSCGYPTCAEHAVAIFQGNSTWDMCFPLQRNMLESKVSELSAHETLDGLTGLWNRRMFGERLADEVARFERYGAPVSLLMLDVDGYTELAAELGREAGEAVLASIGAYLRASLRMTDLPARVDEDRFAVILPGIAKTRAFAVGEKLRASIAHLRPEVPIDGYTRPVEVRVSVGVASASPSVAEAPDLIEAADAALLQAKESGRDQVRLAPD